MSDLNIETINFEKYKRRLESGNPVTIEELENELKVLIKEMIEAATQKVSLQLIWVMKRMKNQIPVITGTVTVKKALNPNTEK